MTEIVCTKYHSINKGSVVGSANIYIPKWGVEIYGVTLFEKDGKRWVSLPQKEITKDGEKKYLSFMRFKEKSHMEAFGEKVKDAIDKFVGSP